MIHASQVKGWGNCDITQWPTDPWHVLLLFMPPGSGANTSLETCDAQGVFRLFDFCRPLYSLLPDATRVAIHRDKTMTKARNEIMHSGAQAMGDEAAEEHLGHITDLIHALRETAKAQAGVSGGSDDWKYAETECGHAFEKVGVECVRAYA